MDRITKRKDGRATFAPAESWTRTPIENALRLPYMLERLAEYEDTGMTPEEIGALKAERDAAVRDLETLMLYGERFRCEFCEKDKEWCACCEVCAPKWRGLKREDRDG